MIIGIALVVDELHKGQRLVYRYPESVPSSVLNSTAGLLKFHQDYQSLSPDNFAKLFRPKASLFNKILELTIDDLHYISFPCPCSDELSTDTSIQKATDVITLFNVVIATVRDSAIKKLECINSNDSKRSNKQKSLFSKFEASGSDPVAAALGLQSNAQTVCPTVLRRIVETISRALLNQEKRNRYVSKQVALMLRLQEETTQVYQQSLSQHQNSSVGNNNVANDATGSMKKSTISATNSISNDNPPSGKKKPLKASESIPIPTSTSTSPMNDTSPRGSAPSPSITSPTIRLNDAGNSVGHSVGHSMGPSSAVSASSSGVFHPTGTWTLPHQRAPSPSAGSSEATVITATTAADRADREAVHTVSAASSSSHASPNVSNISNMSPNLVNNSTTNNTPSTITTASASAAVDRTQVHRRSTFDKKLEVMECMQQQSSLANELRLVYHGLIGGHSVNLMINSVLSINIRLSGDDNINNNRINKNIKSRNTEESTPYSHRNGVDNGYLTLLTIADKDEVLEILGNIDSNSNPESRTLTPVPTRPLGSENNSRKSTVSEIIFPYQGNTQNTQFTQFSDNLSSNSFDSPNRPNNRVNIHPDLQELIGAVDPTVSLEELSGVLEQPLTEVFAMCCHLQDWGLGRLIPTITSDRRYRVNPNAPTTASSRVARTFSSIFHEPLKKTIIYLEAELRKIEKEEQRENEIIQASITNNIAKEVLNAEDSEREEEVMKPSIKPFSRPSSQNLRMLPGAGTSLFNFSNINNRSGKVNDEPTNNNNNINSNNNAVTDGYNYNNNDSNKSKSEKQEKTEKINQINQNKLIRKGSSRSFNADKIEKLLNLNNANADGMKIYTDTKPVDSIEFGLNSVLAVFDGHHNLEHSIKKLPPPLHAFGVDIAVWLLRWEMIEEVSTYVISISELEKITAEKGEKGSSQRGEIFPFSQGIRRSRSSDGLKEAFKPPLSSSYLGDLKNSVSTDSDIKGIIPSHGVNEYEQEIYSKISPYFDGITPLHELAWREGLLEEEILKLVKKNPNVVVFYS